MSIPIVLRGTFGAGFDFSPEALSHALEQLPGAELRKSVLRYRRPAQRWMSLLSRRLLLAATREYSQEIQEISWVTARSGRPSVPGLPDFNLSHSGQIAVCVLAGGGQRVGVDVQEEKSFSLRHLQQILSPREAVWVGNDSQRATYVWSRKEAVSKLLGVGMAINYRGLDTLGNRVVYNGLECHLFTVPSPLGYQCSVALDQRVQPRIAQLIWETPRQPLTAARQSLPQGEHSGRNNLQP